MNIIHLLWVYKKKFFRFKQSKRMEIYKTWMDKKSIRFKSLLWSELFISIPSFFVCGKITSRGRNWWERFLCSIYIFPHTFLDLVKFPDKILMSIPQKLLQLSKDPSSHFRWENVYLQNQNNTFALASLAASASLAIALWSWTGKRASFLKTGKKHISQINF